MSSLAGEAQALEILSVGAGGAGIARPDGRVWFVPGALPGDRVLARPARIARRHVEARLVAIVKPSEQRRRPPCAVQPECGGCPLMPLGEEVQRGLKARILADALARLGGLGEIPVEPVRTACPPLRYRSRVELTLGRDPADRPVLGYHRRDDPARLVEVERCPLEHEEADAVLASTRAFLLDAGDAASSCFRDREPFRIVIRHAAASGELLLAIRESGPVFPLAGPLADHLSRRHPELRGVVRLVRRGPGRGGTRTVVVRGRPWIEERVGRTVFRLPAASFLQVNAEAASLLVALVHEVAAPVAGKRVWDLYGGVGMYGLELARTGAEVAVCDADADAVRAGREACRRMPPGRVLFHHARVGTFLGERAARGERPDVVVANPPRTGLDRGVVEALVAARPERIVLVSCDPATLARDMKRFAAGGFGARRVVPVDLFPQTAHLETVVFLTPGAG